MRRRSITGPLVLLIVGGLFLWHNLHPEAPIFDIVAQYWPFLLIGWGFLRLLEVAFWRDARHGGFTGGEILLVVLVCIAGSATWAAHQNGFRIYNRSLEWWGTQFDYPLSASAPAAGVSRIVFENPSGNIKVTGADTKEVTVTGHKTIRAYERAAADRTDTNTPLEIVPQGDRLLVRTNQERALDNQQISDELEVTVPRSMAVEDRGRSGDFDISDISGDVELGADRGDVRLARIGGNARLDINRSELIRVVDLKGRLDVQGRGGADVELENIAGPVTISGAFNGNLDFKKLAKPLQFEGARNTELSAQAVPGQITMDLGDFNGSGITGPMRLVASSRDIRIEQFTESLELENTRGDIELQPGRLPLPSIEARSGSGRIDVVLPEKATFQLDATAERGEAFNDWGPPIQQENDGRAATMKGRVGEGPTIHITTTRGRISIRKEGSAPPTDIRTDLKETKM